MITLYPHQQAFVADIRDAFKKHPAVLGQAATGFGKTVVGAYIAEHAKRRGSSVIFAVHRKNLITQTAATFDQFGIPYGYIAAGRPSDFSRPINIASIETLRRRLDSTAAPSLLVVDEAHLSASKTWRQVINHYLDKKSKILGLSATPGRLDGRPLGDLYSVIVPGPSMSWLISQGYLSDYTPYAPGAPDLSGVKKTAGDYARGELADAMDKPTITGSAAKHYAKLAKGTRALAYCTSIKHSKSVVDQFVSAGISAAHVDGNTPAEEQKKIISSFASGGYSVLCNADLFTTGFDLSAQVGREVPIETIIVLRPTQSVALHLQMLGRGLRKKPNPAVILDHAGNLLRHGFPDDGRAWTLDGVSSVKKNSDPAPQIRQCAVCYFAHKPAPACPKCGYVYPIQSREIEEVDGTLEILRRSKRAEERAAQTYGDFFDLARQRGHKNPAAFASKKMLGRAKNLEDVIQLGKDTEKTNPEQWASYMWRHVIPKIRRWKSVHT